MTLQRRLALTLVGVAIPLMAGFAWVRTEVARRTDVQVLRDVVLTRALAIGREECESAPTVFLERLPRRPGPGPRAGPFVGPGSAAPPFAPPPLHRLPGSPPDFPRGPAHLEGGPLVRPVQVFTYDNRFAASSIQAPPFPTDLRRALEGGADQASRRVPVDTAGLEVEVLELAVRTGWPGGPCAVLLARRPGPSSSAPSWHFLGVAGPLLLGLVAAVWVASGPLVRRVRALTGAVRVSARSRYETAVPETGRDEITDLARAFNEAGAEVRTHIATVERRDRTLREFLANTTHDVMIPLTVLQGHLSSLQKDAARAAAPDPTVVVSALQEAQYMASLLQNLGAVAKLEAPESLVQLHPVDLNALVERVVARHRPVAGPAGIAIEFAVPDAPVVVQGDVTLLEQAVGNVVHNAIRYNRAGGHVAVVLEGPRPGGPAFRLRVLDDGPGVPPDRLARLSERRYREDQARHRDPNGLGLGLAIAREVADRHGLELRIGASEAGGLEVQFEPR